MGLMSGLGKAMTVASYVNAARDAVNWVKDGGVEKMKSAISAVDLSDGLGVDDAINAISAYTGDTSIADTLNQLRSSGITLK